MAQIYEHGDFHIMDMPKIRLIPKSNFLSAPCLLFVGKIQILWPAVVLFDSLSISDNSYFRNSEQDILISERNASFAFDRILFLNITYTCK